MPQKINSLTVEQKQVFDAGYDRLKTDIDNASVHDGGEAVTTIEGDALEFKDQYLFILRGLGYTVEFNQANDHQGRFVVTWQRNAYMHPEFIKSVLGQIAAEEGVSADRLHLVDEIVFKYEEDGSFKTVCQFDTPYWNAAVMALSATQKARWQR